MLCVLVYLSVIFHNDLVMNLFEVKWAESADWRKSRCASWCFIGSLRRIKAAPMPANSRSRKRSSSRKSQSYA